MALLGTLRPDGSPLISPIEPCIADGQLLIGAMGPVGEGLIAAEGQRKVEDGQSGQGNRMAEPLPREARAGLRRFLPSSDTEDRGGAQRADQ